MGRTPATEGKVRVQPMRFMGLGEGGVISIHAATAWPKMGRACHVRADAGRGRGSGGASGAGPRTVRMPVPIRETERSESRTTGMPGPKWAGLATALGGTT